MSNTTCNHTTAPARQLLVVSRLRELILAGELAGGERLGEVALATRLDVSRTPIREALITLTEEGLVEYRPNRGYVVRVFTLKHIMDAYLVRESLEGVACRLASQREINLQTRKEIQDCLEEADSLLARPKLAKELTETLSVINHRFHQLIVGCADSPVLVRALSSATQIPYSSSRVAHWFREDDPQGLAPLRALHSEHHAIFRAVCAGEAYRAEVFMRGHITSVADQMRAHLLASGSYTSE